MINGEWEKNIRRNMESDYTEGEKETYWRREKRGLEEAGEMEGSKIG